ncbi:MAG: DMT family transporter [Bacillota bacterium]
MNKQLRSDLMLILVTVFWGATYLLTKLALDALQPFNLTALRFIIAFAVSAAFFHKQILRADIKTIKYSAALAVILFTVFITMTFGLKYTTASNAGFLVSLSVVFIPIISAVVLKQKVETKIIKGIFFAVIGIALLTLNSRLSINSGDLLCILCALLFAAHVVATGVFTRSVNSISLSVIQLGFVGVLSIIFSLFTESVRIPNSIVTWFAVLTLSILCTAVSYVIQTVAQKYTSATHTGLILSLEPVFSALFAFLFLGEVLTLKGYIGAAVLLFSILYIELDFKKRAGEDNVNINQ